MPGLLKLLLSMISVYLHVCVCVCVRARAHAMCVCVCVSTPKASNNYSCEMNQSNYVYNFPFSLYGIIPYELSAEYIIAKLLAYYSIVIFCREKSERLNAYYRNTR